MTVAIARELPYEKLSCVHGPPTVFVKFQSW